MTTTSAARRLGGFGVVVAAAFLTAYGLGGAVGPLDAEPGPARPPAPPATVEILNTDLRAGARQDLAFRLLDARGEPVTSYPTTGQPGLVLIGHDLTDHQYVHPAMAPDGTWRVPVTFAAGGLYRLVPELLPDPVLPTGDVVVHGEPAPERRPPGPGLVAEVDGYRVTRSGDLVAGDTSTLHFTIEAAGAPVADLERFRHLTVVRHGDLTPARATASSAAPGPVVSFSVDTPAAGTYRLFLDFRHGGVTRTAEFTVATAAGGAAPPGGAPPGHGH